MNLFEHALTRYALMTVAALSVAALLYLAAIAARALYRQARGIAQAAGHRHAGLRAVLRMSVWAAFFGLFYLLAFVSGQRLGWWAVPLSVLALVAMLAGLLLADRLLTVAPGARGRQAGIVMTLVGILGLFAAGIVLVARV
jgi:hypothetical protein